VQEEKPIGIALVVRTKMHQGKPNPFRKGRRDVVLWGSSFNPRLKAEGNWKVAP